MTNPARCSTIHHSDWLMMPSSMLCSAIMPTPTNSSQMPRVIHRAIEEEFRLQAADDRLRSTEAVLLALEGEVRHGQPLAANRLRHPLGLIRRHHLVLQALKENQRARQPIDEVDRRSLAIEFLRLGIRPDQRVEIARLELVGVLRERLHVADAVVARPG